MGCPAVNCQVSELVLLVHAACSENQHIAWAAGIVLANLGALEVSLTDLAGNLPLLQENVDANGEQIVLLLHNTPAAILVANSPGHTFACCFAAIWQHM